MSVYNDMANDAGCRFGTDENRQMAAMIEADEYRRACERDEERAAEEAMEADKQQTTEQSTPCPICGCETGNNPGQKVSDCGCITLPK